MRVPPVRKEIRLSKRARERESAEVYVPAVLERAERARVCVCKRESDGE